MSTQVQFRSGTTAEHSTFTGAIAEVTVDTTKYTAVVHDGSTAGGIPLAKESDIPSLTGVLFDTDISVTVQGYDAATAKLDEAANFTAGLQAASSDVLADNDIGVTVQAYDVDIATIAAAKSEMEAGIETALRSMSPLRVAEAIAALGGAIFQDGYVKGGAVSPNSGTPDEIFDITAFKARSSDNTVNIDIASDTLDITSSGDWASGSVPTLTDESIFVWAVSDTVDYFILDDATGSNISNAKKIVGGRVTDSSGDIVGHSARERAGGAIEVILDEPILELDVTTLPTGSRSAFLVSVPVGRIYRARMAVSMFDDEGTTAYVYISEEDSTDVAPSGSTAGSISANNAAGQLAPVEKTTNTSSQLYYRSGDASVGAFRILLESFIDERVG